MMIRHWSTENKTRESIGCTREIQRKYLWNGSPSRDIELKFGKALGIALNMLVLNSVKSLWLSQS